MFINSIIKLLFLFFLLSQCSVQKKSVSAEFDENSLIGEWEHFHEHDEGGIKTFRSSSFDFPPSRGREKIILKEEGILDYTPIPRNDLPRSFTGTWRIYKSDLILEYDNKKKVYKIVGNTNSVLKLK